MSLDGEICAYVRGCKNKNRAISIAATIFGTSEQKVISALQSYGLLDENGKYIEPVRMTGKEVTMGVKGQKINYPTFQWSPKRKEKLQELYWDEKSVSEIAAHFDTDEDTVYRGIAKLDIVRVTHKHPATEVTLAPTPVVSPAKAPAPAPMADMPSKTDMSPDVNIDRPLPDLHIPLKDILHFVVDAANHNDDALGALFEKSEGQVCFELGQQCVKLGEAAKLIKRLLDRFPEP